MCNCAKSLILLGFAPGNDPGITGNCRTVGDCVPCATYLARKKKKKKNNNSINGLDPIFNRSVNSRSFPARSRQLGCMAIKLQPSSSCETGLTQLATLHSHGANVVNKVLHSMFNWHGCVGPLVQPSPACVGMQLLVARKRSNKHWWTVKPTAI
jgi:hypothetical protein